MAVADFFLKIDGIHGESQDKKHKGEIEVESFAFGVQQRGDHASGGGGGAGRSYFHDFSFTKRVDRSSPQLKLACAWGQHFKSAVLTVRKAGADQQEYMKYTLHEVLVSMYAVMGSAGHDIIPKEQVHLNYGAIETEYKEQKADGTLGGAVKTGWNLKTHAKM